MPHHVFEYFLMHLAYKLAGEHALKFAPILVILVLGLVYTLIAYNMFHSDSNNSDQ